MVYAFDPVEKRKLWEYNLYEPGTGNQPALAQVIRDRDGNYRLIYNDGWAPRLGQLGPVGPGFVSVQSRKGLVAFDPVSGAVLWSRSDVSPKAQLFGDDQFIYVVEVNAEGKASPRNDGRARRRRRQRQRAGLRRGLRAPPGHPRPAPAGVGDAGQWRGPPASLRRAGRQGRLAGRLRSENGRAPQRGTPTWPASSIRRER